MLPALLEQLTAEFPGLRIIRHSDSPLIAFIATALRILTGNRDFGRTFCVIGQAIYVPDDWESMDPIAAVIILRHERIHLLQVRRYGMPMLALLYLLPFFPLGLAYFRARLEWEAFEETLRATRELRGEKAMLALRPHILEWFTGPRYGWMWPFPSQVGRWFDEAAARLTTTYPL